jgi:hypothetical protein
VEGDTDANLLFVDASTDRVGVGTNAPTVKLDVVGNSAAVQVSESGGAAARLAAGGSSAFFGTYSNHPLLFLTDSNTKATLDTAGNLGLGVTPSAWSGVAPAIQLKEAALAGNGFGDAYVTANAFYDGSNWKYIISTEAPARYALENGAHTWSTAAGGTAGNTISFTQAMTLNAAGELLVGGTTVYNSAAGRGNLIVEGSSTSIIQFGIGTTLGGYVYHDGTDIDIRNAKNGALLFATNGTQRASITSGGNLLIGTTSDIGRITATDASNVSGGQSYYFENTNASLDQRVMSINASRNTTNGTYKFLVCSISAVAQKLEILDSGTVNNATGTYGTISDERLKQDIVDVDSQWDDIKSVRFRKYRLKSDVEANPNAPSMLGVVAQELEQTSPGLVFTDSDGTKSVKSSILLMKAAVALQEAMTRIEALEAEVAALKGAN